MVILNSLSHIFPEILTDFLILWNDHYWFTYHKFWVTGISYMKFLYKGIRGNKYRDQCPLVEKKRWVIFLVLFGIFSFGVVFLGTSISSYISISSSSYILFLFEQGHWVWFNNYWLHHNPITALNPHCQELLHYVPKKENHKIVSQNRLPH